MKCPSCGYEFDELKKYCKKCGYQFTFDYKWKQLQKHENLEKEVLIKCCIIAFVIAVIFSFIR